MKDVAMTTENLDRLRHGWFPRADARWYWWMIADAMVLVSILKPWRGRFDP